MQLPNSISGTFNRPITLGTGYLEVWNKTTGFKIATYTASDVIVAGSSFSIDITGLITSNGEYYIKTSGLFTSSLFNESYSTVVDATHGSDWWFEVLDGEFEPTEFTGTEFLNG